ncbi:MAG: GAF domain-containing protein [Anaerolineales bacterium]|nr:GAF domain-containing protein [Anaerolineales bacterium]
MHMGKLYRAATATFDFLNPPLALSELLQLAEELLQSDRIALYEYDESASNFIPRFAFGISVSDLGHVASYVDHPVLRDALSKRRAASTDEGQGSFALPLGPGTVACAPCITSGVTAGLIFVASDTKKIFEAEELTILEVLATRAAEILTQAKQTESQSFLFHKLSLLYQASHAISGTKDRQEAIRQTATHLLKATAGDVCEIMVYDDGGSSQTTRFRQQLGKPMQATVTLLGDEPMPEYPAHEKAIRSLQPDFLSLSPPIGSSTDIAMLQTEGIHASAIFPLATGSEALGIARVLYNQPGKQSDDQEMELAQAIANIGAVGIQDAIHLETSEARASQLQVLSEIGREMTSSLNLETALENAMLNTQRLFDVEACVLFLLDELGDKLVLKASGGGKVRIRNVAIRLEEGIAGWVTRNQKPLIVNDVRSNPLYHSAIDGQTGLLTTSILCVPLAQRNEVLGVIEAINHPNGAFSEGDQQLLSSVAAWAAVAVDNANLFQRVADERSRLEATLVETADAVVMTDIAGRISLVNKAASQAFRINPERAIGRMANEVFPGHPLGDLFLDQTITLPISQEVTTPADRTLYATISEITDVGRVAVMQDITALKQIDRMRSQLLGTAAHDLKNPLNAIRLGADLLMDADLNEQQHKALNMMQRATESMTNLITALLETIRVESTANIVYEPCQINDLIRHAIEDLRPLAEAKKQTIRYHPPEEPLLILGDPSRLNSVMSNLMSNAVKFTQTNGEIDIGVTWDVDNVVISVKDNGPGIPEEEIPRIFDHLFRGRITVEDPDNPIEGTGLGLALTKTIVEQHGGRVWVESSEGDGSTFVCSLPREPTSKTGSLQA